MIGVYRNAGVYDGEMLILVGSHDEVEWMLLGTTKKYRVYGFIPPIKARKIRDMHRALASKAVHNQREGGGLFYLHKSVGHRVMGFSIEHFMHYVDYMPSNAGYREWLRKKKIERI